MCSKVQSVKISAINFWRDLLILFAANVRIWAYSLFIFSEMYVVSGFLRSVFVLMSNMFLLIWVSMLVANIAAMKSFSVVLYDSAICSRI